MHKLLKLNYEWWSGENKTPVFDTGYTREEILRETPTIYKLAPYIITINSQTDKISKPILCVEGYGEHVNAPFCLDEYKCISAQVPYIEFITDAVTAKKLLCYYQDKKDVGFVIATKNDIVGTKRAKKMLNIRTQRYPLTIELFKIDTFQYYTINKTNTAFEAWMKYEYELFKYRVHKLFEVDLLEENIVVCNIFSTGYGSRKIKCPAEFYNYKLTMGKSTFDDIVNVMLEFFTENLLN